LYPVVGSIDHSCYNLWWFDLSRHRLQFLFRIMAIIRNKKEKHMSNDLLDGISKIYGDIHYVNVVLTESIHQTTDGWSTIQSDVLTPLIQKLAESEKLLKQLHKGERNNIRSVEVLNNE